MHLLPRMNAMLDLRLNAASPAARNTEQANITKNLSTVGFEPATPRTASRLQVRRSHNSAATGLFVRWN